MAAVKPDPGQDNGGAEQKPDVQKIKITVQFSQQEETLQINVKPNTTFAKIYKAVADHQGKDVNAITLTHDGTRIKVTDTPASEEVVDMHLAQIGGDAFQP
ncbi:small ubiquitin-related modifier 3 precursor [Rhodotorula toruloides]|uniref:Small ubiquitin-related modifier 3 n=1 Tax=Rhodotorula toruloides TaxID=5286 RepID=A0A511K899_RHOTO|nr:small ubiquitin-related modifier 3 precursor [Rhodotorula toruloides]